MKRRITIPLAILILFVAAGWTRNKLAADRQGDWVRIKRGDLITGVDVTGTLAALDSGSFGPPQLNDVWDFQYAQTFPNSGINDVEVSLLTSRVLGSASLVKLQCYDGSGAISAKNAVISAIKVGNLS